ncbi:hypothetical protein CDD80_867 [Ophiocordyceps camponoti-rufipedis]|uniref:Uncharacterized protein n=1 Tax=Ophiocordyceps camponoti-rufipedis TaxID=2004952 RepID=A0A2C5YGI0_9HYPO|nr:hypothetical protein CDD80_867 [Ophiocordyceps camponoti-rufipedis]
MLRYFRQILHGCGFCLSAEYLVLSPDPVQGLSLFESLFAGARDLPPPASCWIAASLNFNLITSPQPESLCNAFARDNLAVQRLHVVAPAHPHAELLMFSFRTYSDLRIEHACIFESHKDASMSSDQELLPRISSYFLVALHSCLIIASSETLHCFIRSPPS